jgi:hypothetical protein
MVDYGPDRLSRALMYRGATSHPIFTQHRVRRRRALVLGPIRACPAFIAGIFCNEFLCLLRLFVAISVHPWFCSS